MIDFQKTTSLILLMLLVCSKCALGQVISNIEPLSDKYSDSVMDSVSSIQIGSYNNDSLNEIYNSDCDDSLTCPVFFGAPIQLSIAKRDFQTEEVNNNKSKWSCSAKYLLIEQTKQVVLKLRGSSVIILNCSRLSVLLCQKARGIS